MTTPPGDETNAATNHATDTVCVPAAAMGEPAYAVGHGMRAKCGGKTHQGVRGPCKRPAGAGTPHLGFGFCSNHGGCTPSHVSGAELEMARFALEAELRARGRVVDPLAAPVTDPVGELGKLAGTVRSTVEVLHSRVNALSELTGVTDSGSEQVRAVVGLWERMIKQSESLLTTMARLGIEDRSVRLEEEKLDLVARVLAGVVGGMLEAAAAAVDAEVGAVLRAGWAGWAGVVVPRELAAFDPGA